MRIPAVAIAAAFAGGIALGLCPPIVDHAPSGAFLACCFAVAALLVVTGLFCTRASRIVAGALASLFSWIWLGVLSALIASQPLPANQVRTLIAHGQVDLQGPLRWHGTLREEPAKLPWGYGYEIELSGVEFQNTFMPVIGGMRLSYTPHPQDPKDEQRGNATSDWQDEQQSQQEDGQAPLANLHAGDKISVLAEARRPRVFRDEGAFDRRAYLEEHGIDLIADLRAPQLLERLNAGRVSPATMVARLRRRFCDEIDALFGATPQVDAVLRAMLLGDRTFVERDEAIEFQKTGVFHVLVVAGLHAGAITLLLFLAGRKLRLPLVWTILPTLLLLALYVALVEQRPPVMRAGLMAAIVVLGGFFYRRLDLLNSAALAAVLLLLWRPLAVRDSSFQLTFLAIGCIAGIALPSLERTVQPYAKALRGWRDVTRDVAHEPRAAQFRIDLRIVTRWIAARSPQRVKNFSEEGFVAGVGLALRAWELLAVTLVLQIGMLPLMARDFHRIALSAPFVNLFAVPLTGVIVPLGFLALCSALILPHLQWVFAAPLRWLALLLLHVVQWFANLPRMSYRIPGPPLWLVSAFFLILVLLAVALRLRRTWQRAAVLGLCCALAFCALPISAFPFSPRWSPGKLELTILDVGQGDALFLVFPHGRTLLIDGGGAFNGFAGPERSNGRNGIDPGEEAVSPYLWSRGYKKIDVVALTHAHQDHLGGLVAVLENFRVSRLWIGREVSVGSLAHLEAIAHARGVVVEHEDRTHGFSWDSVQANFLWPEVNLDPADSAKNNDSLVLRLHYGHRALLLPGDAEKDAERAMLAENDTDTLRSDVLKVGHHGSKNSTLPEFLAAVQPRLAVISAGEDNPYGHPSRELLTRLENAHVRMLRTDRDGAVHVLTDGEDLEISCFVACSAASQNGSVQAQAPDRQQHRQQNQIPD